MTSKHIPSRGKGLGSDLCDAGDVVNVTDQGWIEVALALMAVPLVRTSAQRAAAAYNAGKTTQLPGTFVANTGTRRISRKPYRRLLIAKAEPLRASGS